MENRAQTGSANAGPNPTTGNTGTGHHHLGNQGGTGGGMGTQGVTGQPQGNTGVATTGGAGGGQHGVSGSYETHRHKDDLDEKGEYRST